MSHYGNLWSFWNSAELYWITVIFVLWDAVQTHESATYDLCCDTWAIVVVLEQL